MRFNSIRFIVRQAKDILSQYKEQHQQSTIYRIIEIEQLLSGKYKIIAQIIGKSTLIECTPQELVVDNKMLEGFSKRDIRTITYFACEPAKKPKYKIVMQEFCGQLNKVLFKLKFQNQNEPIVKTATQITMDKDLINDLSCEDVQSISYIAGYEHSQARDPVLEKKD